MKKIIERILIFLSILIAGCIILFVANDESLPQGTLGKEADDLALKMLSAINKDAFDTTEIIEWNFRGKHQYRWKKQEDLVEVLWDENKVTLHLKDPSKSEGATPEIIQTAQHFLITIAFGWWLHTKFLSKVLNVG